MKNFKELLLWQDAHKLVLDIYEATKKFSKEETFGIASQVRRAAVSIPCNIAEGCGKRTSKDFANFLQISLGSANETDYLILLSKDLGYIGSDQFINLQERVNKVRAMNINLLEKVRQ